MFYPVLQTCGSVFRLSFVQQSSREQDDPESKTSRSNSAALVLGPGFGSSVSINKLRFVVTKLDDDDVADDGPAASAISQENCLEVDGCGCEEETADKLEQALDEEEEEDCPGPNFFDELIMNGLERR